jgi:excinuclease ABC subunit A
MCPTSGISYREPAPHDFSFNSPQGACPRCKGLGYVNLIDVNKVIPDSSLSVKEGAIAPLGKARYSMIFWQIQTILENYGCKMDTPICDVPEEAITEIIHGSTERLKIPATLTKTTNDFYINYEGLAKFISQMNDTESGAAAQKWAEQFNRVDSCPECHGMRLNREALHFRIAEKNIAEVAEMDLLQLKDWLLSLDSLLTPQQKKIAAEIIKEIQTRLQFLLDVGLEYLSLSRSSASLSGGESQRIRLAT